MPLVADFHDMRNRLSYYYPILRDTDGVRTPITQFYRIEGDFGSYPELEYREITRFMQEQQMREAFVRGDYSSAKYDESGRHIESQDPYDIEGTVIEMMRQLARGKRYLGSRIAVREWVPPEKEVRYFFKNGHISYKASLDDPMEFPDEQAERAAKAFDKYAWSCDFIKHEDTGKWYCIDMGLDGLYHSKKYGWTPHSEHHDEKYSPKQYVDEMPNPKALRY
ncbi:hypothetical protein M199_gp168 [Halogranum tailed virus 1]|uniref:ATP-grasp domain-containing protein n=1 Tax=Halogranum tailed virus 1 TaxID=1273749 RepID=R4TMT8_9CAUD|nr:hypothetical protein M199_gp168 [Halogranum tailed virus 1]AGM11498.1 hypothetical protein HGTV1_201 [Halogranum tailed virus 1]